MGGDRMGSLIYKEITQAEMQKIAADLYGSRTKIEEARLLKGGLYNTTYFVKTNQDDVGIVLRVGPVNKHLLFDFEKDMMAAEPFFHKMLADNGIPTSHILRYAPAGEVIDREYIVMAYIPSIPMNDPSLAAVCLDNVYQEIGALTHKLHAITQNRFGWLRPADKGQGAPFCDGVGAGGSYDTWAAFVAAYAGEAADRAAEHGLFDREDIQLFRRAFSENTAVLDEIKTPHMVHTDLWQGNVLLKKDDDGYSVAAIIDLDRTIFGDVQWDLSCPWMLNEAFFKGYGSLPPKTPAAEQRERLYKMLCGFFESYVWLIEYDDKATFESTKENTLSLLRSYR